MTMRNAFLIFMACVVGCCKSPQYTEAEVVAAQARAEMLMVEYARIKNPADVDRILDSFQVLASVKEGIGLSVKLPLMGFMHGVFAANPNEVSGWQARKREFKGTVIAEVLAEAADFDEEKLLRETCGPGVVDYCWGAFYATGER